MKTLIPKTFTIGALDFTVKHGDFVSEGNLGHMKSLESEIVVKTMYDNVKVGKQQQELTFFHELAHVYMSVMNEHELNANEQFIDILGQFMYQYSKTVKYK